MKEISLILIQQVKFQTGEFCFGLAEYQKNGIAET